jgi:trafficking protein particle complex subunit 8
LDSTDTPSQIPAHPRIPDVWSSIINETNTITSILQSSVSTPSSPFETGQSVSSPTLQTFSLPLSPTSALNSPSSEEFFASAKERESSVDAQSWLGLGTIGSLPPSNIQYGLCLSEEDFNGIKAFIREFVAQSVIPFMERNIQRWNEQVIDFRDDIIL